MQHPLQPDPIDPHSRQLFQIAIRKRIDLLLHQGIAVKRKVRVEVAWVQPHRPLRLSDREKRTSPAFHHALHIINPLQQPFGAGGRDGHTVGLRIDFEAVGLKGECRINGKTHGTRSRSAPTGAYFRFTS